MVSEQFIDRINKFVLDMTVKHQAKNKAMLTIHSKRVVLKKILLSFDVQRLNKLSRLLLF